MDTRDENSTYWSCPPTELLEQLSSRPTGLTAAEAAARLERDGPNLVADESRASGLRILARQFRSPLVLVLLIAAAIAGSVGDRIDMLLIGAIVLASTLLGFTQEYRASRSIHALRSRLALQCRVWRDGAAQRRPTHEVVAGDVVDLAAGSLIPTDGVLLTARDCFVVQSVLTGGKPAG